MSIKVNSYLLLPLPEKAGRYYYLVDYQRIPQEAGGYNMIYVIACNTEHKEEIAPLLNGLLAKMKDVFSAAPVLKNDIERLENIVDQLNNSALERRISQDLLDQVCRTGSRKFTPDEVIYLSALDPS